MSSFILIFMSVLSSQLAVVDAREVFTNACDNFSDHTQRLDEIAYENIDPGELQEAILTLSVRRIWSYVATSHGRSVRIGDVLQSETRYAHLPKLLAGNLQIGPLVMTASMESPPQIYCGFALYKEN